MATVSSTIQLVDRMSETLSKIEGNINSMKDTLKSVTDKQADIDGFSWNTFLANAEAAGEKIQGVGKKMTAALTAPLLLLGKKMYNNAVEYESAYVGMTKTVEGTVEQYEELNDIVLQLSETTPSSYTELMGIAQTGGNFDVAIENMETFLKSYSALQAATDQHISGETGAESVAKFLNVTEGDVSGIERFSSAIVDLGNNYATTEDQILGMGNRMAAAAHLAGVSTPEILGMSAAFSSVGINEEAGGSAASKFIKQMQLAAEVGGTAQEKLAAAGYDFQSALDFSYAIDSMKKSDIADMAETLGMTTDAVKSMADSWVLMDQFSEVSGKTAEQFISDWGNSPVQAMSDFFTGLSQLGDKGGESILTTLDKMGLTEIRESNLIAAMASRPELFASAIQTAVEAYGANNALWEEFGKQTQTQEAQNAMLGNKLQNTMADLGDNLVQAFQPVLDIVNNLLEAFNNLSETDQTNIIKGLGVIALLGPGLTVVGTAVSTIAKMMELISGHGSGAASAVKGVVDAANGATATGTAAEAGLSMGAKIVGGAAIAGVSYLFAKGIEYRNEHGALGSVEAIQKATADNLELQDAFVEWVASNNEVESMIDIPDLSDEKANEIVNRQQEAINKFFSMDNAGLVQDLYNDWRETNNLSAMDWLLPEDFLSTFDETLNEETLNQSGIDVAQGLANGIAENDAAIQAAQQMGVDLIDAANQALGVQSPSTFMIQAGQNIDDGLRMGIQQGQEMVIAAADAMGNAVVVSLEGVLSSGAAASIGSNFAYGLANGIRAGQGAVSSAAMVIATAALNAAKGTLGIHSPSAETYWQGEMLVQGYVNALNDGSNLINKTVSRVLEGSETSWNNGIWDMISGFASIEAQALQDQYNDVTDGVKLSDSDITKIRNLAEREVINKITSPSFNIEMSPTVYAQNDMDVDGIISRLEDKVTERLEAVAEGVYT